MSALLWVLIGLPLVAGTVLCLGGNRLARAAVPVSLVVALVITVLAVAVAVVRPSVTVPFIQGAGFGLAVDSLSAVVLPSVAVVALLVLVFASAKDIAPEVAPQARFHGLMLIFVAAVIVTATATTLPALLFSWELMGAMSYALIGFRWQEQDRVSAGLTAFLTTRGADLGLYVAAGAALAAGSGLALDELAGAPEGWRHVIAAGILVAALGKAAQLPFSFWLSRAMEGPSPVSALLHSAAMVAMGGYLLLRMVPLLEATGWAATAASWVGVLTALVLGAVAMAQKDLKQLLAASTAAQLGFVVLGAGLGATAGGTAHLVAHAATKALLFLAAGAWLAALGTKKLQALRGAGRRWPLVGVTFAVGALSLAGVAPLSLWATKDEVLAAALEESPALYVVGLAASMLSAAYAGKALIIVWRKPLADTVAEYDTEEHGTRHIGVWERVPLVLLAVGAALLGMLALPSVGEVLRAVLGDQSSPTAGWWELALSAVLAVAVLFAVARFGVVEPRWAAGWLGLERGTHLLIVRPALALASSLARFDDRVLDRGVWAGAASVAGAARGAARFDDERIDGAVEAASRGGLSAATAAAKTDTHGVDAAVEAAGRGARRLGSLARRPQTGQVHHYYAQAAVVLSAALVLLLLVR
ncbi:proton-conducting transporter transmembrane domain-containing protein [Arthrobacter sp. Hz1]